MTFPRWVREDERRRYELEQQKARERDRRASRQYRELSNRLELLAQKVKTLYVQISALGALLVGDMVAHYTGIK